MCPPRIDPPADTPPDFYNLFGQFHAVWLANDTLLDYAICQLLGIQAEDTHIIVSGMMFGAKSRLLLALLKKSNHKNKASLTDALKKIQAARALYGEYGLVEHRFTAQELRQHVADFIRATQQFQNALGADNDELLAFVRAADPKASKSPTTSPQDPLDKK
jgi:hypothetical protein